MHRSSNRGNRCSPRALREGFGNSQQHHSAANPLAVSGCVAPLHAPSMSYSFSAFLCSVTCGQPLLGLGAKPLSCSSAFKAAQQCVHKIAWKGHNWNRGEVRVAYHCCFLRVSTIPVFVCFFLFCAVFSNFLRKTLFSRFSKNFDFFEKTPLFPNKARASPGGVRGQSRGVRGECPGESRGSLGESGEVRGVRGCPGKSFSAGNLFFFLRRSRTTPEPKKVQDLDKTATRKRI